MNGIDFIATVIATGRFHGIGLGSSIDEVENAFRAGYIDDVDDEENRALRRDYGLIEVYFNDGPAWTVVGAAIEVHRLATVEDLADEWREDQGVEFPEYVSWEAVKDALSQIPDAPALEVGPEQSGYIEYRSAVTRVSALVVDSQEERDAWPGHGDVFSVHLA